MMTEADAVEGLELGADDFIRKPFGIKELVGRINAVLRRTDHEGQRDGICEAGNIRIDLGTREVYVGSRKIDLSPKEFDLLHMFLKNENKVLTNDQLLNKVWDYDSAVVSTNTLTVHISRLRDKLGANAAKKIVTEHKIGYKFQT